MSGSNELKPAESTPAAQVPSSSSTSITGDKPQASTAAENPHSTGTANPQPTAAEADVPKTSAAGEDLTQQFAAEGAMQVVVAENEALPVKDRFLSCELVVPAISLKKMALCLMDSSDRSKSYAAVLGLDKMTVYRVGKPCLKSMIVGDLLGADKDSFWASATKHLTTKKVGAVMIFDNCSESIESATWPQSPAITLIYTLTH